MRIFPGFRNLLFKIRYGFRGVPLQFHSQVIRLDESLRRWDCLGENSIHQIFDEVLHGGDCIIDVGANFGMHSLYAAKRVAPSGVVYAFEPLPTNLSLLRHHVSLNDLKGNVEVIASAVSDSPEAELVFYSGLDEADLTATLAPHAQGCNQQRVPNTRLDDFALRLKKPVRLVKIDVEGAEVAVLKGARKLLLKDRPLLIIEVHAYAFGDFKTSLAEYREVLDSLGYDEEILPEGIVTDGIHYLARCTPRT